MPKAREIMRVDSPDATPEQTAHRQEEFFASMAKK